MDFKAEVKIPASNDLTKTSSVSTSPSTSSSNTTTSSTENKNSKTREKNSPCSKLNLLSLNTIILSLTIFILQLYLIVNRFKSIRNLNESLNTEPSHLPFTYHIGTIKNSIILNAFLVSLALLISILTFFLSCVKTGVYSHDNFLLGKHFDSKNKRAIKNFRSDLPPIGACLHLTSAFLILFTEVHLSSKRIQLGKKPIGDIFSTRLDFLFGEPINRLKNLNLNKQATNLTKNDLIQSKDDFTMFDDVTNSDSILFLMASTTITLDFLNFFLALLIFSLKVSQIFWSTSRRFSSFILLYTLNILILTSVSYSSFEILFKSNLIQKISKSLILKSGENNFSHDSIVTIIYAFSLSVLFTSSFLIMKFGLKKFHQLGRKFEKNIDKYYANTSSCFTSGNFLNETKTPASSTKKIRDLTTKQQQSTKNEETQNPDDEMLKKKVFDRLTTKRNFFFLFQKNSIYFEQLISSLLFLIYCSLRSVFIYEVFTIYKFTNDALFLATIIIESLTVLIWVLALIVLTCTKHWDFRLHSSYKLIYWNHAYFTNANKLVTNSSFSTSPGSLDNKTGDQLNCSSSKQLAVKRLSINEINNNAKNCDENKIEGLLVRDDMQFLNRSNNMSSSSSITEVSALMQQQQQQQQQHHQPINNVSINSDNVRKLNNAMLLNASNLTSSVSSTTQKFKLRPSILESSQKSEESFLNNECNVLVRHVQASLESEEEELRRLSLARIKNVMKSECVDNGDEFMQITTQKRSASFRPSASSSLRNSSSKTLNSAIATIEEIMEPNLSRQIVSKQVCDLKPILVKSGGLIQRSQSGKVSHGSDMAMSYSGADSGRDSMDSPGNQIIKTSPNTNNNSECLISSKTTNNLSKSTASSNSKIHLNHSSHLLDTHC